MDLQIALGRASKLKRQINAWAGAHAPLDSLVAGIKMNGEGVPSELVLHNSEKAPVEIRFGRKRTFFLNPRTTEMIASLPRARAHSLAQWSGCIALLGSACRARSAGA